MAFGMGPTEVFIILLFSSGGSSRDLVSFLDAESYFNTRNTPVSIAKMVELAQQDPKDAKTQIGQLLALRYLAENSAKLQKEPQLAGYRQIVTDIAQGRKAQDKLGFAKAHAQQVLDRLDGKTDVHKVHNLAEGLKWFPVEATFAGCVDLRNIEQKGPDAFMALRGNLFSKMPMATKEKIFEVAEQLGNIRLDRVSFAQQETGKRSGRWWIRVTGAMQQAWVVDTIKKLASDEITTNMVQTKAGATTLITGRRQDSDEPIVAFIGDGDVVMAIEDGGRDAEGNWKLALAVIEQTKDHAANGKLKDTLGKISVKASAMVIGDIPAELHKEFTRGGPFNQVFPKAILGQLVPGPFGFDVSINGELANAAAAMTFVQGVSKLRAQGIEALQQLRKNNVLPPQLPLDAVEKLLNSMQIQAKGNEAHFNMLISSELLRSVPAMMMMGLDFVVPAPRVLESSSLPFRLPAAGFPCRAA